MFTQADLLIGVDVHQSTNVVQMLDGVGHPCGHGRVPNHGRGCDMLLDRIEEAMTRGGFRAAHLAAEATSTYWLPLFCQLEETAACDLTLYLFNPRVVADYKGALGERDKTDTVDAYIIAERLRLGKHLPQPFSVHGLHLPLRTLTRHRLHLVNELVRLKTYAHHLFFLYAPTYVVKPSAPFSDPFGATSRAVFTELGPLASVATLSQDALVDWLYARGNARFADPEDTARRLRQVAHDAYKLPPDLCTAVSETLTRHVRLIDALQAEITQTEKAIAAQLAKIPNTLTTIPGIGPTFAAGLISEIGHLARFDYNAARVAAYAGLTWPRKQSADYEAQVRPLDRRGNRILRYYLCEAAQSVQSHNPEYRAYYTRKYKEAWHHHHRRAIVLTARKLVRLIVRLLTTNEPYRPKEARGG